MAPLPSISVVIPCFNARRWIVAAVRSVLAQDWPDLEIVVVDDGSTDGSAELVSQHFPQVRLLRRANAGVAAARNAGVEHSRGEWIAFLDADDIWLPGKLKRQWQALSEEPTSCMACSGWQVWTSEEPEPDPAFIAALVDAGGDPSRWQGPSGWIYPDLLLSCEVWTSTVLVKRQLLDEVGGFDPTLRVGEDLDLWLRTSRQTPIVRVPAPLALYRMHPSSITKGAPAENYEARVIERAVVRWGLASPDGRAAAWCDVQRTLARTWDDYAGAQLRVGNARLAWQGALRSLRHDWRRAKAWSILARSTLHAFTAHLGAR